MDPNGSSPFLVVDGHFPMSNVESYDELSETRYVILLVSSLQNISNLHFSSNPRPGFFNALFDALCVNNRRRRSVYLAAVVMSIVFLLFAREYFPPVQFLDSIAPTSDLDITSPNTKGHNLTTTPIIDTVEPVVFTFIMWSEDSALEGALLIKVVRLKTFTTMISADSMFSF